jgi:hypothetical protein
VPQDTHPRIEAMLLEGYRRMTLGEKFERVQAMNETVLQMAAARIRSQYHPTTGRELRLRVAALWLGDDTMRRVFGWDPAIEGR